MHLRIPGNLDPALGAEIEEAIWDDLHFASHLRTERLGEFTIGTDLHRSESLALIQLLDPLPPLHGDGERRARRRRARACPRTSPARAASRRGTADRRTPRVATFCTFRSAPC